jgi:hypothetical protein
MTNERLEKVVDEVVKEIVSGLGSKGKEYSDDMDRLRNFKDAANFNDTTTLMALWGFVTKHIIAIKEFIIRDSLDEPVTEEQWNEKIYDIIRYMVLLKALLVERREEK